MPDDRIVIEDLDPISLTALTAVVPVMKDGATFKMTMAQIQELILRTKVMLASDSYDILQTNGLWMFPPGGTNAPEATAAYAVRVEAEASGFITQYARAYAVDGDADTKLYRREYNGNWGSWTRVRESQTELDARYIQLSISNANGRDILLNASTLGATLAKIADAAAGRAALGTPPLPVNGAGLGQWVNINTSSGNGAVLPAGGTWAWFAMPRQTSTGLWAGGLGSGISAGGSTVTSPTSDVIWVGLAWRIS